ncbi:MAG: hypothetical protein ACTSYA_05645 [Candidatus Kariarchaeaceae archaeon]
MILYDIVQKARTILIDTATVKRWSNSFFQDVFNEAMDEIYSVNISKFYDSLGRVVKLDTYLYSNPTARATVYAVGDIIHNSDDEFFECTTAGTSHSTTEPTWNLGYEQTTSDGSSVFTNLDRQDIPFENSAAKPLSCYLIAKAYEIDATDQTNYELSQSYMEKYKWLLT